MSCTRLKDVVRQQKSSLKLSDLKKHGAFPVFGASGLVGYRDCFQSEKEAVAIIKDGAGIGRVSMLPKHSSVLGTMQMLEPKEGISNSYLFYFLSHLKLGKSFTGSTIPHIYFKNYSDFSFPDISYNQQCQVAEKLDAIRKSIEQKNNQLSDLDSLVKSRFIEMFGNPISEQKWIVKKWNDVLEIKNGKDYKKNLSNKENGYPVYGSGGFMNIYADTYLCEGIITIIGRKGNINNPLLVEGKIWNVDTAFGIIVKSDILNPIFFHHCSKFYDYEKLNKATTIPSLTKSDLLNLEIIIPPIELQDKFADFVHLIDKSRFVVQKEIKDLQELLDSKMDEYFGGEE